MSELKTVNGHSWFVAEEGEGPALLFIHGWAVDGRIWLQQRHHFSQRFRCFSVDLPGHGKTPFLNLDLATIAKDILAVTAGGDGQKIRIVGSSFGGVVGIRMHEFCPEKIASLSLVGSQPRFLQAPDHPWGLTKERIQQLREQLTINYPNIIPVFFRSLFTAEERASDRFKWLQSFRKNDDVPEREALLALLDVLCAADLRREMPRIKAPIQFINGRKDPICTADLYENLKKGLPRARFDWMEGCGHFPFVSRPAEFNRLLEDFLEQVHE